MNMFILSGNVSATLFVTCVWRNSCATVTPQWRRSFSTAENNRFSEKDTVASQLRNSCATARTQLGNKVASLLRHSCATVAPQLGHSSATKCRHCCATVAQQLRHSSDTARQQSGVTVASQLRNSCATVTPQLRNCGVTVAQRWHNSDATLWHNCDATLLPSVNPVLGLHRVDGHWGACICRF